MIYISIEDWNEIHKNYKSVWTHDNIRGTNYNGKKTWTKGINGVMTLLIEGVGFEIVDLDEDGNFDKECLECDGRGLIAHEDFSYNVPDVLYSRCPDCRGEGTIETEYNGI